MDLLDGGVAFLIFLQREISSQGVPKRINEIR